MLALYWLSGAGAVLEGLGSVLCSMVRWMLAREVLYTQHSTASRPNKITRS